jgi:hypothetical protein
VPLPPVLLPPAPPAPPVLVLPMPPVPTPPAPETLPPVPPVVLEEGSFDPLSPPPQPTQQGALPRTKNPNKMRCTIDSPQKAFRRK